MLYELNEYQRQLVFQAISMMEDQLTKEMNSGEADPRFRSGREQAILQVTDLYAIFRRKATIPCKSCGETLYMGPSHWSCFKCDAIVSFEEIPKND